MGRLKQYQQYSMNNRDSNEKIYRNLEKCYTLLQVHIIFSFHTLIYII
nr:MAG TPA: hypothetical protein [Caudoviricetes sp.]